MTCIEEAKERTKSKNAPVKENIPDISSYEVLYMGSPIYWGGMPEEMFTAFNEYCPIQVGELFYVDKVIFENKNLIRQ